MKKPKRVRRKAKFWKGQVVGIKGEVGFVKIKHGDALTERWGCVHSSGAIIYFKESELRPLTATEIGPRRNRGR